MACAARRRAQAAFPSLFCDEFYLLRTVWIRVDIAYEAYIEELIRQAGIQRLVRHSGLRRTVLEQSQLTGIFAKR